ncbi:MAG: hypothetical protein AB7P99_10765 [Vicinamibacterales bacterium]
MKSPDGLFFAPGIRFRDLDLDDSRALAHALAVRADSWFFTPAEAIADQSAFASGIILVCFIDAAANFMGVEFSEWLHSAIPETRSVDPRHTKRTIAESFYDDVRNGLVHHARLNRGAEFSLDLESAIALVDSVLVVNPRELLPAIQRQWAGFLRSLEIEPDLHAKVKNHVGRVFRVDFEADRHWQSDR